MNFVDGLIHVVRDIPDSKMASFGSLIKTYAPYFTEISRNLYEKLCKEEQVKLVTWFLKRWGDIDIVNPIELGLLNIETSRCVYAFETVEIQGKVFHSYNYLMEDCPVNWIQYSWCEPANRFHFNQYTHKDCFVKPGDTIIDAGGFIGDTAIIFDKLTDGKCKIHSFEVYEESVLLMSLNLEKNNISDNAIINKLALGNETGRVVKIKNPGLEGAVCISNEGVETVETITIDDYVLMSGIENIDFIKMDIEGSELEALQGARNTIKHFRPKLAICIYHKPEDIISIPKFIEETGVNYKIYFKWDIVSQGGEAVLFAVPC